MLVVPHERVWAMVDSSNGIARNLLGILAGRIRNDNLLQVMTPVPSLEFEVAANIDTLTGLHNKGWMEEAFQRMAMRCERSGVSLFLLLVDIDRFKELNDRHGHLAGDIILKGVARILTVNLRPQDLLVYMGGDSFAVLLLGRSLEMAMTMAERLREAVATPVLRISADTAQHPGGTTQAAQQEHVTISLGVSVAHPGDTLPAVLEAAEGALHQAKADGRNQVRLATEHSGAKLKA